MQVIVKELLKVTEDPHKFAEECSIAIEIYQSSFSGLYQLVHIPVGENQAKPWMKLVRREHPEGDLEKQTPDFGAT